MISESHMLFIRTSAYRHLPGNLKKLGLMAGPIPDMHAINTALEKITGWNMYSRPELQTDEDFFGQMLSKKFGVRTGVRHGFHDTLGFAPLLADPVISSFLLSLARIAERFSSDQENLTGTIRCIYDATIRRGLVKEGGVLKLFGSDLISSEREGRFALSKEADRKPFDLPGLRSHSDSKEQTYFVLESLGQLSGIAKAFNYELGTSY